ncbi:hypothetical protein BAE44_0025127 [Dichanthelium oligosanthes]|uniref:RRM domain-containing protein n=1 Tax=Dichanthelium oligosanthes TaxID=888268 RepID=A0A1E5ULU8_9POAL|nr:hypothetical protein BAE44_0025127 [Dichanthelium oligosanthes]
MRKYFEQFGEILEAVVITDKNTGRSKGYGFVTFRDPDAAMRACVDPAPVIDGRRANCNLASLGVQRSRPPTPQHGGARSFRVMKSFSQQAGIQGGLGAAFPSHATFPHYAIPQGLPYHVYGYSPYTPDYGYPTNFYNIYGGAQYPFYGGAAAGMVTGTSPFYPYFQFGQSGNTTTNYTTGQGYNLQYPQMFHFSTVSSTAAAVTGFAQQFGGSLSLAASPQAQAGMTMALTAPTLPTPTQAAHPYRLIPSHFAVSAAPEQPLA